MSYTKSILLPILSQRNAHARDLNLLFDEPTHKYTVLSDPDSAYTSVTTWNHSHFPHFNADEIIQNMMKGKNWNAQNKYWGLSSEQIKKQWADNAAAVSGSGTDMHYEIECFMNQDLINEEDNQPVAYTQSDLLDMYLQEEQSAKALEQSANALEKAQTPIDTLEWKFFLKYLEDLPDLKPYRTEWTIYDEELKIAGSIDMVYENPDGTLAIYDWKRVKEIAKRNNFNKRAVTDCIKHLPDTNFWHYSLQLNTYKAILEAKYGKKVTSLYLVRLHPDNPKKTYELIQCADLSNEIADLFALRREQIKAEKI